LEVIADGRLQIKFWFDSEDGLPTANDFRAATAGFERGDAYLCGPERFMQGARAALSSNGYSAERIYQESFAVDGDSDNAKLGSGRAGRLTVKLKGQIHEVDVRPGQPLLSAMLEAGLQIPHSCKVGECASCMCRLIEGNVEMLENSVLDEEDLSNGWILACSSRATTDHLAVNFSYSMPIGA
jgi:3-ketosteroid 9alpha-monooxygenase subunit B